MNTQRLKKVMEMNIKDKQRTWQNPSNFFNQRNREVNLSVMDQLDLTG
jgi:exonuclease V gamma subunit